MIAIKLKFNQLIYNAVHVGHPFSESTFFSTWFVYGIRYSTLLLSPSKMVFFWKKGFSGISSITSRFGSCLIVNLEPSLNYLFYRMSFLTQQPLLLTKWRGGLLTNWKFVFLRKIPSFQKGVFLGTWSEEFMSNLKVSTRLPSSLITFNLKGNFVPLHEAQLISLPIFAISDSDIDTNGIMYPLPGNDDAISSVTFCSFVVSKSILVGRLLAVSKYLKIKNK